MSRFRLMSCGWALMALVCLLPGCDGGVGDAEGQASTGAATTPRTPVTAPALAPGRTPTATGGAAQLSFERLSHNFGLITDTKTYTTSFPFKNTGTGQLIIQEIKPSCGCTSPRLSRYQFMPGEGDVIEVTFDPKGMKGSAPKTIKVVSNSQPQGVITLTFTSSIKPLLRVERRFLPFGQMKLGQRQRGLVNVSYNDPDLQFKSVSVNHPNIDAKLVRSGVQEATFDSPDALFATIEVVVSEDLPWGTLYSTRLTVDVNGKVDPKAAPIDHSYEVYVQGGAFGDLESVTASRGRQPTTTSTISLGSLKRGARFEQSTDIQRTSGQPFSVLQATVSESTMPGMETRVESIGPSAHRVYVFGTVGTYSGLVRGKVAVETDVPGEEHIEILFTGRAN